MFGQQLGKEIGIQAAEILQSIGGRKLGGDSQVERRIPKRKIEIDQHGALARLLGKRYGKVAGDGGDAGTAFGAE